MRALQFCAGPLAIAVGSLFPGAGQAFAAQGSGEPAAAPFEIVLGDKAAEADPFLGDWESVPGLGQGQPMVAQVIPRGSGRYRVHFLAAFDQRCPPFAELDAQAEGGVLRFDHDGWSGRMEGGLLQGTGRLRDKPGSTVWKEVPLNLKKITRAASPRVGASPPEGALVLFDGKQFDNLESDGREGKELEWQRLDDCLRIWPPLPDHSFGAALRTRRGFPDFHLHLEFRLPLIAAATGQTRANSGVIIEEFEFYEVQILDSYGLPGYWDECGALYNKEAPKVNACRPPGQWQSYDIVFHGPRFDADGNLAAPPLITVDLNGKRIHHDVELPYSERALQTRWEKPESRKPGRITFQNHGDPVDLRNIWILELKD